jgi:hypothetical protein
MIMPFGKFKGQPVFDLPYTYLRWLRTLELHGPLAAAVEQAFQQHLADVDVPPLIGDLDCDERQLLDELLRAGYRTLSLKHHPDVGGNPDIMKRLNALMEKLRGGLQAAQQTQQTNGTGNRKG